MVGPYRLNETSNSKPYTTMKDNTACYLSQYFRFRFLFLWGDPKTYIQQILINVHNVILKKIDNTINKKPLLSYKCISYTALSSNKFS